MESPAWRPVLDFPGSRLCKHRNPPCMLSKHTREPYVTRDPATNDGSACPPSTDRRPRRLGVAACGVDVSAAAAEAAAAPDATAPDGGLAPRLVDDSCRRIGMRARGPGAALDARAALYSVEYVLASATMSPRATCSL